MHEHTCKTLQAGERLQVFVDADLAKEHLEAGVDGEAEGGELLDDVAKNDMCHHRIANKHDARHDREVQQVGASEQQRARHDAQAWLEMHQIQDARDHEEDVDAIECIVPRERLHQVLQVRKRLESAVELRAVAVEAQDARLRVKVGVYIVANVDVERWHIAQHESPPHDVGRDHEGRGSETNPCPPGCEVRKGAACLHPCLVNALQRHWTRKSDN